MSLIDAPPTTATEASRPERSARASAWVSLVAVLVAFLAAPSGSGDLAAGEFGRVVSGRVEVDRGGRWETVAVGETVAADAVLRTVDEPAELTVREGTLSLARLASVTLARDGLTLERGAVLFDSDRTYRVRLGTVVGEGRGTWRVDAAGLARYATYRGGVAVSGLGGPAVAVQRLEEAPVLGGVDRAVQPLRYLAGDPWDERLLADALSVDRSLERTRATLALRYGTALQDASFYADFTGFEDLVAHLDQLAAQRDADGRVGPPAPTLVALIVADLLVQRAGLTPAAAAETIDELREGGATWGLVVVLHDLGPADLDASIERGLRQRGEAVESGEASPVRRTAPRNRTEPDPTPEATPPPDQERPRGEPTEPEPDPSEPPPDEEPETLDPAEEQVEDLGALLDPIVPGAGDVAEDVADGIDTVDELLPPPPSVIAPSLRADRGGGPDHPGWPG